MPRSVHRVVAKRAGRERSSDAGGRKERRKKKVPTGGAVGLVERDTRGRERAADVRGRGVSHSGENGARGLGCEGDWAAVSLGRTGRNGGNTRVGPTGFLGWFGSCFFSFLSQTTLKLFEFK